MDGGAAVWLIRRTAGRWWSRGAGGAMAAKKYLVRVSESAFMHMTLATIAAYDVPRQAPGKGNSARWNETYGLLWGHKISSDRESCIYSIEHATIDAHAKSPHPWVFPS